MVPMMWREMLLHSRQPVCMIMRKTIHRVLSTPFIAMISFSEIPILNMWQTEEWRDSAAGGGTGLIRHIIQLLIQTMKVMASTTVNCLIWTVW